MNGRKYEPLENLSLQKSNTLVSAKYKSSLLENQIMAVSLTRIEMENGGDNALVARLYPGELKRLIGSAGNIYRTLKKVAQTMTGHTMFIEDGKGNFKAWAMVNNADYVDGIFTVEFNKNLRQHILGLEKNYTSYELSVLTDFKRNSSFRLYELLKSHIYKSKKEVNNGRVDVEYNISELRFMIGLANGDDPGVRNAMATMGNNIDWDILYSKLDKKDRKYESWYDFRRYVVDAAKQELEEKSNIRFEYQGVQTGRKTGRIRFEIYPNELENETILENLDEKKRLIEANAIEDRQYEIPMDVYPELYEELVGHNGLTKEDVDMLLKKAGNDPRKVMRAVKMADAQPNIRNYVGWLVKCIEEDYQEVEVLSGSAENAEVVRTLLNAHEERKKAAAAQEKAWQKVLKKEDFADFLDMVVLNGLSQEVLEQIYSAEERLKMYSDWRIGKEVEF